MSAEAAIFLLRLLAGLALLGFLLTLFLILWRSLRQMERLLQAANATYGHLIRQPPGSAQLDGEGERHPLRAITTLGRAAGNAIVIKDDFASAEHARICLEGGQWWLEDRQSRNGTRLNDAAIKGRAPLADGDEIGIGRYCYRLALEREAES